MKVVAKVVALSSLHSKSVCDILFSIHLAIDTSKHGDGRATYAFYHGMIVADDVPD